MTASLPPLISMPWCGGTGGNKGPKTGTLPLASTGTQAASYNDGFPLITTQPIGSGGVPPMGADFNAILNQITTFEEWVNAGGHFYFSSALSAAIGGYPVGAVLLLSNNLSTVICTTNGNTVDPSISMTGWAPHGGALMATAANLATTNATLATTATNLATTNATVSSMSRTSLAGSDTGFTPTRNSWRALGGGFLFYPKQPPANILVIFVFGIYCDTAQASQYTIATSIVSGNVTPPTSNTVVSPGSIYSQTIPVSSAGYTQTVTIMVPYSVGGSTVWFDLAVNVPTGMAGNVQIVNPAFLYLELP